MFIDNALSLTVIISILIFQDFLLMGYMLFLVLRQPHLHASKVVTPHDLTTACGWTQKYTMAQNCQYMQEFMEEMYKNNLPVGITSNSETWNIIFGSTCNNIFSKEKLYWFPFPTIDDDSTLNSFVPFGGWPTAQMKVFSCPKFCNLDMTSYFCNQIFE